MPKGTNEGGTTPRKRKPLAEQSMSVDVPGVPAMLAGFCRDRPQFRPQWVEERVRAAVNEAATKAATGAAIDALWTIDPKWKPEPSEEAAA